LELIEDMVREWDMIGMRDLREALKDPRERVPPHASTEDPAVVRIVVEQTSFAEVVTSAIKDVAEGAVYHLAIGCTGGYHRSAVSCEVMASLMNSIVVKHHGAPGTRLFNAMHFQLAACSDVSQCKRVLILHLHWHLLYFLKCSKV